MAGPNVVTGKKTAEVVMWDSHVMYKAIIHEDSTPTQTADQLVESVRQVALAQACRISCDRGAKSCVRLSGSGLFNTGRIAGYRVENDGEEIRIPPQKIKVTCEFDPELEKK